MPFALQSYSSRFSLYLSSLVLIEWYNFPLQNWVNMWYQTIYDSIWLNHEPDVISVRHELITPCQRHIISPMISSQSDLYLVTTRRFDRVSCNRTPCFPCAVAAWQKLFQILTYTIQRRCGQVWMPWVSLWHSSWRQWRITHFSNDVCSALFNCSSTLDMCRFHAGVALAISWTLIITGNMLFAVFTDSHTHTHDNTHTRFVHHSRKKRWIFCFHCPFVWSLGSCNVVTWQDMHQKTLTNQSRLRSNI